MTIKMIVLTNPCPVMLTFAQLWRSALDGRPECEAITTRLLPLLAESSSTPSIQAARAWMAVDWMTREFTSNFLDLTPSLNKHSEKLRALSPIVDEKSADNAKKILEAARKAAWSVARKERQSEKKFRSLTPPWNAARVAGWFAAMNSSATAARPKAWEAASSPAWDGARAAAVNAAQNATEHDLLRAVEACQASALALLERMAALGEKTTSDLSIFFDCSRDEEHEISEEEQDAFLESYELRKLIPTNAAAPAKKARRI